jgi:Secretion system C-terminal sorting domain
MSHRVRFIAALVLLALPITLCAQIPNAGFETWAGSPDLVPAGWVVNFGTTGLNAVTRSATAHAGSFSAQGTVVSFGPFGGLPPFLTSTFPYGQRPGSLTGYYQFAPVGGDSLLVAVWLFGQNSAVTYAVGSFSTGATVNQWTQFTASLHYANGTTPDSAYVQVTIDNPTNTVNIGSSFLIDDLSFVGTPSDVNDRVVRPRSFSLEQNYPNPFNPSTTIEFSVPAREVTTIRVFDLLGREVSTLVNGVKEAGSYTVQFEGSGLPTGVYFCRMQAGEFVQTRRLVLVK